MVIEIAFTYWPINTYVLVLGILQGAFEIEFQGQEDIFRHRVSSFWNHLIFSLPVS